VWQPPHDPGADPPRLPPLPPAGCQLDDSDAGDGLVLLPQVSESLHDEEGTVQTAVSPIRIERSRKISERTVNARSPPARIPVRRPHGSQGHHSGNRVRATASAGAVPMGVTTSLSMGATSSRRALECDSTAEPLACRKNTQWLLRTQPQGFATPARRVHSVRWTRRVLRAPHVQRSAIAVINPTAPIRTRTLDPRRQM
jgi:hypothetical protein